MKAKREVFPQNSEVQNYVRRLVEYERVSGIFWIILGIFQILCIVTIIAGIWNIFAGISRLKMLPMIEARQKIVLSAYEGLSGYIILGIVNFLFGGVIGIGLVFLDLYIRDKILSRPEIFDNESFYPGVAAEQGRGAPSRLNDLEYLENLANMRDRGVLTEAEFQALKSKILDISVG